MKGNLAPLPTSRMSIAEANPDADSEPRRLALAAAESPVIRAYAAFLLALDEDASIELDDGLTRHLDAVGEAIGFL